MVRLTEYSHGAGCGCKISPKVLDQILQTDLPDIPDARLIVGNGSRDDAAVYDMGNGVGVVSTTDFFMPIVDDPSIFGKIAATNAISDIYAMGGTPLMAIAIFGWPLEKLSTEVAQQVIEGGRQVCQDAGIALAGGHSIDAPEPIFGLAVTGQVPLPQLKRNDTAKAGDYLYLTKPLGVGILSTAQKQKLIEPAHENIAIESMLKLNSIGTELAVLAGVHAMTDVTGFGLGGHLREMCEGSGLTAEIQFDAIPLLSQTLHYLQMGCSPGGAGRNFDSYGHCLSAMSEQQQSIVCDPQTSGGLLLAVDPAKDWQVQAVLQRAGMALKPIGYLQEAKADEPLITVT